MEREALNALKEWKKSQDRKPMILNGARQVGKTWIMKEFGKKHYPDYLYVNLEDNKIVKDLFELDFNVDRIIKGLEVYLNMNFDPNNDLLILDEIQECPKALTSLKYFYEKRPEINIIVGGSILGVTLHKDNSFPVGKTNFLEILPLNFSEFLIALGYKKYCDLLENWQENIEIINSFHVLILDLFKQYMVIGGMPEVVNNFVKNQDFSKLRQIQNDILNAYEKDFSKHAPFQVVPKIREVWNVIPSQLAKENKKFIFSLIRKGARAKEYENALLWLENAGLIRKITKVRKASIPLKFYEDINIFKIFMLDSGLLLAKSEVNISIILEHTRLFNEFEGAFTEQIIFQTLNTRGQAIYYYAKENSKGEIDFIIDLKNIATPIEVKSSQNLTSKSLNAFIEKNHTKRAIKFSTLPIKTNEIIWNLPIYLGSYI